MADTMRVMLEIGPRAKKVVAVAPDWPGLERGAKTEEAAIERIQTYLPRYAPVAKLAGMDAQFAAIASRPATVDVIERYPGTGSTDFWGISFSPSDTEQDPMSDTEFDRNINLLRACWALFDMVAVRVSPDPTARAIVAQFGAPVTATSANPTGQPPCRTAREVRAYFPDLWIASEGPTPGGAPSTLARVKGDIIEVLRPGPIVL